MNNDLLYKTLFYELVYTEKIIDDDITKMFLSNVIITEHDKTNKLIMCKQQDAYAYNYTYTYTYTYNNLYLKYYYMKYNSIPYFKTDFYDLNLKNTTYCMAIIDKYGFVSFYVIDKNKENIYKSRSILRMFFDDYDAYDIPNPYSQ